MRVYLLVSLFIIGIIDENYLSYLVPTKFCGWCCVFCNQICIFSSGKILFCILEPKSVFQQVVFCISTSKGWHLCSIHIQWDNFLPNPHNYSCPWGRDIGCILWVWNLTVFCQWHFGANMIKLDRVIMALNCMYYNVTELFILLL